MTRVEEYRYPIGPHQYVKRWSAHANRFVLLKDGEPVTVTEWNEAANRAYPMAHKAQHPNVVVRWLDRQRCQMTGRLVRQQRALRMLDIGCETGYVTGRQAHDHGMVVMGDLDLAMLQRARSVVGTRVRFVATDVTRLPFRSGSFDLVVCTEVLEHLEGPREAVSELARILAPGGRLIISVPNDLLILRLKRWISRLGLGFCLGRLSPTLAMGHLQLFTKPSLRALLAESFTVKRLFFSWPYRLNLFAVVVRDGVLLRQVAAPVPSSSTQQAARVSHVSS